MSLQKLFSTKNVGDRERILRGLLGFVFVMMFFTGRLVDLLGIIVLVVGIALIFSAVTGSCAVYSMLGRSSCPVKPKQ